MLGLHKHLFVIIKVMRKINFLAALVMALAILSITSCSQDEDMMNMENNSALTKSMQVCKTQMEANMTLVNYLELVGDKYVLKITEVEAEEIGVPSLLFKNTLEEIKQTNELITRLKKDPSCELQLTDPQIALKSRTVKYGPEPLEPTGTLTTNGQEEVRSNWIWVPIGIQGIKFLCRANAAITPAFNCKTYSSGLWQTRTAIGTLGTNTTIKVPLYVSNDNVIVAFSTTDSNGGSATYEGYK